MSYDAACYPCWLANAVARRVLLGNTGQVSTYREGMAADRTTEICAGCGQPTDSGIKVLKGGLRKVEETLW